MHVVQLLFSYSRQTSMKMQGLCNIENNLDI